MDYAILGPLRVGGADGAIELKAAKQRALLAFLLLSHREEGVPMTRLVDVLWGDHPPATATKALQVYVSQLRRDARREHDRHPLVRLRDRRRAGQLDLERFETLVARRRERAAGGGRRAAARGAGAVPRAAAGRRAAARARGDRGRPAGRAAAGRARAADRGRPRARPPRGARGRAGGADRRAPVPRALPRAADARAVPRRPPGRRAGGFRRARTILVEELGLDPGRELQQLEAAILAQDPALDLDAPAPRAAPAAPAAARAGRPAARPRRGPGDRDRAARRTCGCSR